MSTKGVLLAFPSGSPRSAATSCETPAVPPSVGSPSPACPVGAPDLAPLSFPALYSEYARFVWRSLRLLGVAPECLEDAVQDTFAVVARQLSSFERRAALSTWIFAIAQRVAANQRRVQRRKLAALQPLAADPPCPQPSPQASAEAAEAALAIEQFCAQLDDERRRLFILALLEGVSATELAAADGVPSNTLYSRIRSLRLELKDFLARRERSGTPHAGDGP
jgi:RNA polymerase sigma-70 factor (ECF subfamily)